MSTRCQIIVEGSDVVLYRHSDGMPESVLPDLKPIVSKFVKNRGFDESYLPAHIISGFIVERNKWVDGIVAQAKAEGKKLRDYAYYESTRYLGHGLDAYTPDAEQTGLHGDIEWLYVVKKDGTIEIRETNWRGDERCCIENTKLKKTVRYARKKVVSVNF